MIMLTWLHSLQRTTTGRKLIPEIDGLRFLAIAMVVLFHCRNNYLNRYQGLSYKTINESNDHGGFLISVLGTGHFGVQLFFAISGFILVLPFAQHYLKQAEPPSVKRYFLRRLTRLEPPYLVALTIYFAALSALSSETGLFSHFIASTFYLHGAVYNSNSAILNVAWSLEVEVQFYLLAPLLAKVFLISSARVRRIALVGLTLLAAIVADLRGAEGTLPGYFLIDYCQYFFVGFLTAELYVTNSFDRAAFKRIGDLLTVIGAVGLIYAAWVHQYVAYTPPACILLIMIGALSGRISRSLFSFKVIVIFGGACYSIYLYHLLFMKSAAAGIAAVLTPLPPELVAPIYIVALTIASVLPSMIPFVLIEKPTMNPKWVSNLFARFSKKDVRTNKH